MLTRFLSRLRNRPTIRPAVKVRPRGLSLEALEGREVPATVFALNGTNQLLRFDSATPGTIVSTTTVTGLTGTDTLQGIDFRPRTGQLIGVAFTANSTMNNVARTYSINPTTGAATLIGTTATAVTGGNDGTAVGNDIDFNPTVDRIRFVSGDGTTTGNARINPNNGALVANDTGITPVAVVPIGAAYDRDFDRMSAATTPTTLYVIDRASGMLGTLGSVNGTTSPNGGVFTPIGALGITLSTTADGGFDIVQGTGAAGTANNNGLGVAYAALTTSDGMTKLYTINLTTGAATAVGAIGTGTAGVFDLAVVPEGTVVVGSGLGANGDVRLLDPATGAVRGTPIVPFAGYQGGVQVAVGDVNGDGVPDAIVAATNAPNGAVKVFDGATGLQLTGAIGSFFAFNGYNGSISVGVGDVNGDGFADVLVVSNGANANVRAYSGRDGTLLSSFFAYQNFNGDVTITAADFNNDGIDEIVTAAAINGHVKVFVGNNNFAATLFTASATDNLPSFVNSFLAFSPYLGDVSVAAGDFNGDGTPDIALVSGRGVRTNVRTIDGRNGNQLASFFVDNFGTAFVGGATVGASDFNRDGRYDLVLTPGAGTQAAVAAVDPLTGTTLGSFSAFANFQGGATVAGTRF